MAAREELGDRLLEAVAERRIRSLDQSNFGRHILLKEAPRVRGIVRNVAGDRGLGRGCEDVLGDIAQKCRIALSRLVEAQRRNQAGLGASRDRSLGHHGDPAGSDHGILDGAAHDHSHASRDAKRCSVAAVDKKKRFGAAWPAYQAKAKAVPAVRSRIREREFTPSFLLLTPREGKSWRQRTDAASIRLGTTKPHLRGARRGRRVARRLMHRDKT